jgi:hypothetical protein
MSAELLNTIHELLEKYGPVKLLAVVACALDQADAGECATRQYKRVAAQLRLEAWAIKEHLEQGA